MASGALFGNAGGRSQSKHLVEFKAGKMTMKGKMVHADKRKGMVYIYQSEDSLMHFCWRERTHNTPEDDLIIFPDDVEFKPVPQCTTGRVYLLKFKSNSRKMFFWMQEPKIDKDDELCRKLNEYLNNPPAPGSNRGGDDNDLSNILGSMNQQQLMQLLGGMGGMSSLSSLIGGRSSSSLSDSSTPSRIQSSPAARGPVLETPSAPLRPQTASTIVPSSAASSNSTLASSVTPSSAATTSTSVVSQSSQLSSGSSSNASTLSSVSSAVTPSQPPRIQLSDLQNILSGLEAMDESGSSEVDLSASLSAEAMIPILANAEVQQRLIPLLPEAADLPKTEAELRATIHSPQFHQALQSFSSALSSGQLGPLMRQFGLDDNSVAAASGGDMLAFARAMQEALAKKETKPAEKD